MFKDCRLARMSSGRYCLIRDLGLVKGGKGLKHHEVVVAFTPRGVGLFLGRCLVSLNPFSRGDEAELPQVSARPAALREPSR